jgi:hypothetical protein
VCWICSFIFFRQKRLKGSAWLEDRDACHADWGPWGRSCVLQRCSPNAPGKHVVVMRGVSCWTNARERNNNRARTDQTTWRAEQNHRPVDVPLPSRTPAGGQSGICLCHLSELLASQAQNRQELIESIEPKVRQRIGRKLRTGIDYPTV